MKVVPLRCKTPVSREALERYKDVQLIDPRYVAGREHLEFAILQAERAFERGENISNNIFIEILVRASAQRQIKKAFEIFGLKTSGRVVAISEELPKKLMEEYGCEEDQRILEMDEEKYERVKEIFDVDEEEIAAVSDGSFSDRARMLKEIIKERIALIPAL